MNALFYLFIANAVIWVGVGLYIIFLGLEQRNLNRRIENLEMEKNDG